MNTIYDYVYNSIHFLGGYNVKKYESLELEIISVDTDVVLAVSVLANPESPVVNYGGYNPLEDESLFG